MTFNRLHLLPAILLVAYGFLLISLWLPEAQWQLQGTSFTTRLAGQWAGYALIAIALPAALVHAIVWRRRRYVALGPSLVAGVYVVGFAIVKWVHLQQLSIGFQSVTSNVSASVAVGPGIVVLGLSGLLFLLLGLASWFGQMHRKRPAS